MQQNSLEDELLGSRILFLLTYDTKFDFDKLFKDDDLAYKINTVLLPQCSRHKRTSSLTAARILVLMQSIFIPGQERRAHHPTLYQLLTPTP